MFYASNDYANQTKVEDRYYSKSSDKAIKTIYSVPAPNSFDTQIEVYGEPANARYEWRIVDTQGGVMKDTGTEGGYSSQGRQYYVAEIALRDALMFTSGLTKA